MLSKQEMQEADWNVVFIASKMNLVSQLIIKRLESMTAYVSSTVRHVKSIQTEMECCETLSSNIFASLKG